MKNLNIAIYVTGSIAIYKTLSLIRLLIKNGANVKVIMTSQAENFITPLTFQVLSKNLVITNKIEVDNESNITHIRLAQWTEIAIVAPASANFIAKMANGIADDISTTTMLATSATKIVVPAMNDKMLSNNATQANLNWLKQNNIHIFSPDNGFLAEGYEGKGRMIEPQEIINKLKLIVNDNKPLLNKNIVITAGGTREPIDPVRFISNRSSGKMGYAIAKEASSLGANVTLISGISNLTIPKNINIKQVTTSKEMTNAVLNIFPENDILIMAAAVSDFRPVKYYNQKIKKEPYLNNMNINLEKVPDVLKQVAKIKQSNQYTVGFAAETSNLINNAINKLKKKDLNLLVANDVSNPKIGFNSNNNQVTFINNKGKINKTGIENKHSIARYLLNIIINDVHIRKDANR